MPQKFKIIEHTADIGLEIYGATVTELFVNAAASVMSIITDTTTLEKRKKFMVSLDAQNTEELLIAWLNELIFYCSARQFLTKEVVITSIDDKRLKAQLCGEVFDKDRHIIDREVKAATYHELSVKKENDAWKARVIFDI